MTLHWSEEDDDDTTPVVSPSPVFPDERNDLRSANESEGSAEPQAQSRAAAPPVGSGVGEVPCFSGDMAPQSTVHYYWGVPFCPRGLDPDQYTKVIVAQMEVYEKSLKQAQRGFLNKAKWGEPILPRPEKSPSPEPNSPQRIFPKRRSWRLRGKLRELESEEEVEEMTQDTRTSPRTLWEEEEAHEEGDKEMKQNAEEGDEEEAGLEQEEARQKKPMEEAALEELREDGTQGESDCEVCPETQLSDDNTQELTLPSQPLLRSPEIETIQVDSPNVPEPQSPQTPEPKEPMVQGPESVEEPMESTAQELFKPGHKDLEGPHCESQSRESPRPSQPSHLDQDMDSKEPTDPDPGPGPDLVSREESSVQCPLCQRVFPSDQIEMHAAFCDGGPEAAGDKASSKPRRKRLRRGEAENANHTHSEPSVALEKCYVCLKAVPLRDYSFHTDRCFLRPGLRTANTGGLLSALDQSEHRDSEAGPSGSTAKPQEVINLVDDDEDEEEEVSLIQISNSPIRSFTAISDAQDCLIDFSRQHQGKRPGTRLGTKHRSKRR
uniref:Ubiquitin interaction motif-containing protein 1 n=1 Tax=Neogobius melanostomus TaxID=47308 RepID=A0A8C6TCG5_9GOBI